MLTKKENINLARACEGNLSQASILLFPRPQIHVTVFGHPEGIQKVHLASNPQGFSFETIDLGNKWRDEILLWLSLYGQKKQPCNLRLSLTSLSPFAQRTLETTQKIPFGKTLAYAELGALLESKKHARAVGNSLHQNPYPLFIPCHRVISSLGNLGGFAFDLSIKKRLLEFES